MQIQAAIKRKWGYNHTNLMGLEKVTGEFSFIMLVYNIKRTLNILKWNDLIEKLQNWTPNYKGIVCFFKKATCINSIKRIIFFGQEIYTTKTATALKPAMSFGCHIQISILKN